MVKKEIVISSIIVLFGLLLITNFTSALIVLKSPLNFTNHSTGANVYFNVSYINQSADIVDPRNFTIYTNFSGTWLVLARGANTTAAECLAYSGIGSPSCNVTINVSSVNATGYHTLNISFDNGTTKRGAAVVTNPIRIDNKIPPIVNISNTVNGAALTFAAGSNVSGTLNINISALDDLGNWSAVSDNSSAIIVTLNVTNGNGVQNISKVATRQANTQYFNVSIDTTALADGNKTFRVQVKDQSGNINNTRTLANVITDNTAPVIASALHADTTKTKLVITLTLTDTVGLNSTCGTDSTGDSVSGSGSTQTITEENLACGTSYAYVVTCYDEIRNRRQATITHSTLACSTSGGSSGGGGGGGGGGSTVTEWHNTYTEDDEDFVEVGSISQELQDSERVTISVSDEIHHVGVVSLTETTAIIEIGSTPQQYTFSVGDTKKFDLDEDNYYDLSVTLNSITNRKASVSMLSIHEFISQEEEETKEADRVTPPPTTTTGDQAKDGLGSTLWFVVGLVIVVAIVVILLAKMKKKK